MSAVALTLLVAIHCSRYCHPRPPSRPHTHTSTTTTTTFATTITSTIVVVITTIVLGTKCFNDIIYLTSDDKRPPNISYAPLFKYAIWRIIRYLLLLIVAHDLGSSDTDLLHVVTQASTNALPVPMLRQVYLQGHKW